MNSARYLLIAIGLLLGGQVAVAQNISQYRAYSLETSVDAVIAATGARTAEAKTLHARPAKIQELEWRAPYVGSGAKLADPVRDIEFMFYNDALYQVVVTYDRDRTEGLTPADLVESLSAGYGTPAPISVKARAIPSPEVVPDSTVLARWENAVSMVTLVRGTYVREYKLVLASKALDALARTAIRESARLDAIEAPRRAAEQRTKEASDANAARDRTRDVNKEAFRY